MKLTTLLFFLALLQVSANSFSQTRVNLKFENETLESVFNKIEANSEYSIFYKNDLIQNSKEVSGTFENKSIFEILDRVLEMENLTYSVKNKLIMIVPKDAVNIELSGQQQKSVSGKVTDSTGGPLPGVSVVVKGTTTGTITDFDGNYSLANVPADGTLVFSFVGMKSQEVAVGAKTKIDIQLAEETVGLEEVVAVGYGVQKKATLTGAVSSVNSDFIASRPLTNSTQALQGVNGLYVNQAGGEPGADNATIRIRGIGTLNSNEPLVLVDGIEYSMKDVNPNDIESISVLKDAASASIYGNRAANGVILITTRKGKSGKIKAELNSYFGWQKATYLPDMVTNSVDFMVARNQAAVNDKQPKPYSDAQVEEFRNGTDPDIYPNTDWYKIMFSVAPMQDHFLRLSGGTDMVTFTSSFGYMNQEGILMNTNAKKYSLNSNVIYHPSAKLEFGASISGTYWDKDGPYSGIGGGDDSAIGAIARALPIHPNILADGRYGDTWLVTPGHNVFRHPIARAMEGGKNSISQRAMINLYAEYTLAQGLKYKATYAINKYDANEKTFVPEIFLYNPKQPTVARPNGKDIRSVSRVDANSLNTSFFQTLNWAKKISDKHELNMLFGFSRESFYNSSFNGYIEGFLGNELPELNAGTTNKNVGGTSYESTLLSYFGRANYNYSNKYLIETNFRYDGSSRFAKNHRWGFFPSVSVGWRINEEPFMKSITALNNLKLRASWGQLGNQNIPLYSYLNKININQGTTFNNTLVSGSAVTELADLDISWERTSIKDIGFDLGLWDGKLEVIFDAFDKVTTDILARINVPGQVGGLTGPITNLYGMSNKGVEVNVSHQNTFGALKYKIGGNIAFVKNNVDFLNGDIQYTSNGYGTINILKEGYPVNSWYLYEAIGIFKSTDEIKSHAYQDPSTSPGDIIYRDFNDDGKIDANDMRVLGRSVPKYTYGLNLDLDYKNFSFGAFFQGVQDVDIYPTGNVAWPLYNGAGLTKDQLANSWTPENPNAKYPRLSEPKRGTQINYRNSTFWLKDASYLRLKNIQLGYTIPSTLLKKVDISKLKFYVNAQNLLTISKFKLSDPEKNILNQDVFDYPTTKVFSIGCNLTF